MDVLSIQTRLKTLGYDPGPLDNDFGPRTRAAVIAFQKARKLEPDGIVGRLTAAALWAGVKTKEPAWLVEARKDLGLREAPGPKDNPDVVRMFAEAGHPEVKHDAVAWCAAAVGAWLARAGIKGTGSLWALDYAKWGQALPGPRLGAIAVKRRRGGGHVTLVVGGAGDRVFCLGGNQDDAVTIASYPAAAFAYRWPSDVKIPEPPARLPTTITGARAGVSEA
ncbi:hypothetical protein BA190_26935 [Labrys sp. WJW]|uniref:NlpC/P60 family protein n=1 Tax=Labrys sp. WJW TaxID=1737983 RepID=UPI000832873A|nr:TIGR02594 family protein [Labrys sp. WJW]OCC01851.1 hypothetical protein BA190_26935 [Labrys sp. WJW]